MTELSLSLVKRLEDDGGLKLLERGEQAAPHLAVGDLRFYTTSLGTAGSQGRILSKNQDMTSVLLYMETNNAFRPPGDESPSVIAYPVQQNHSHHTRSGIAVPVTIANRSPVGISEHLFGSYSGA